MNPSRYKRQISLDKLGLAGQNKLADSTMVVVGCGGLGSIAAPYLAGAGVGKLILIDGDIPDVSNLHRQVFYEEKEGTLTKSEALAEHINRLNSDVEVVTHLVMMSKDNITEFITGADLVLECTDDIMTKYLVNDACHILGISVVYGAIYKYDGYVSLFSNSSPDDIHLRDIFPEPQVDLPTCSDVGVMNTLAGMIGLLQANEALKYIIGIESTLINKLLSYNILTNEQLIIKLKTTWKGSLKEVYASSSYLNKIDLCTQKEISWYEYLDATDYDLISILENDEHVSLNNAGIHQPLSSLDINTYELGNRKTLYYCQSGKRSQNWVNQVLQKFPNALVYSLKGGLNAVPQDKIDS